VLSEKHDGKMAKWRSSEAQRKAQARYDEKRPAPVSVRMNAKELARLDALRQPGEGRGPALLRLAGVREAGA